MIADGVPATAGMSLIVLPHERIEFAGGADVMIARPL